MKKVLYWLTLFPPVIDLFIGLFKGLVTIKEQYEFDKENGDVYKFIKDNENE